MCTRVLMVSIILGVLSLSACTTPNAEVRQVASATESANRAGEAGFYPLTTRTGIADVDAVLSAVESGDPQELRDLLRYVSIACTKAEGLGGPPKCLDGEAEGSLVEVLPFLDSEGHFLRKTDASSFPGVTVTSLYAVYKVADSAYSEEAYPAGAYAVIFNSENGQAVVIQIREGIVRMDNIYSPISPGEVVERDASELILAPKE